MRNTMLGIQCIKNRYRTIFNDLNHDKHLLFDDDEREIDQIHMTGILLEADLFALETF